MNKATYNYFSHLREVLYGKETEIGTSRGVTLSDYVEANMIIAKHVSELGTTIQHLRASYQAGTGFGSVVQKIQLDNLFLEYNAYENNQRYYDIITGYIFVNPRFSSKTGSVSFKTLIEQVCACVFSTFEETDRKLYKDKVSWYKKTLNSPALSLYNSNV